MAQLIKRQKEDVRGALLNSGPYKLVQELSHLQLNPERWFSMSTTQRQAHEKKFDTALFQDEEEHQETQPQICHMSVKPEDANLTSLPLEAVQRVFRSAEALLSKENAIVQAPGSNKMAFLVESRTSKRPHYVFAERTERITCENCPGWASAKLCKHAVAVGEKNTAAQRLHSMATTPKQAPQF